MPQAAYEAGIPTVVTLHDYWFICPRVNLIRADGSLCAEPVEAARCAWCLLETKRRFREPDILTAGRLGDLVTGLAQSQSFSRITGLSPHITAMEERRAFLKQVLHRADRVVCPSHFIMEKMAEYGFPTHNLLYLPFGLDVSTSNGIGREREPKKLRFGYLGQLARHKGVHTLIQAFHELGDRVAQAELVIYGDLNREPAYAQRLRSLAGAHPGIVFAGPYNNREINQVLSSLDMLVVPSEWFENRPTVILEAFAHRVPALAASIGGIPELVHDGVNGLLFEPGNAGSLARQMERLLDEPGLLAVLKNGIDPVKSVAQEMDELEAIYRSLLTGEKSYLFKSEQVF
jgi:glycosyltransferase involved in cell wall biosynthesis